MKTQIRIKRVYDEPLKEDGQRILVDRLWPRGLTKDKAKIDHWLKEVAPSNKLRKWFGHEAEKWPEFKKRYTAELKSNPELQHLKELIQRNPTTLVYGAKDEDHNQAVVLIGLLKA